MTADGTAGVPGGTYVYQLSFVSVSYLSSTVAVYFLVDDAVTSVAVFDISTTIQTVTSFTNGYNWNWFSCFSSFTLSALRTTTTVLTFTVNNYGSSSGLLVFGYIPGCPTPVPSSSPTGPSIAPASVPTSVPTVIPSVFPTAVRFAVVINNLVSADRYINLADVQLFSKKRSSIQQFIDLHNSSNHL